MNSLINSNSLFIILKTLQINSHFILNTLQIVTTKHNNLVTSHHTIWLITSNNLVTLSIHKIIIKISHISNTETKFYHYFIRFISSNLICTTMKTHCLTTKLKLNLHIMSMFSSMIHLNHNTVIYSIHATHTI